MHHCFKCKKEYATEMAVKCHYWRAHTTAGKRLKPTLGRKGWNKGKTTSADVKRKISISNSKPRAKLTQQHKANVARARRRYLAANPDKVPFRLNHSSKESYPEMLVRLELTRRGVNGWIQEYQQSIYNYDFAFVENKLDVEIDGSTHLSDKVKLIDARRDAYSNSLGWKVCRIPATEVLHNVSTVVDTILGSLT